MQAALAPTGKKKGEKVAKVSDDEEGEKGGKVKWGKQKRSKLNFQVTFKVMIRERQCRGQKVNL